jgi:hypothetical protein
MFSRRKSMFRMQWKKEVYVKYSLKDIFLMKMEVDLIQIIVRYQMMDIV